MNDVAKQAVPRVLILGGDFAGLGAKSAVDRAGAGFTHQHAGRITVLTDEPPGSSE